MAIYKEDIVTIDLENSVIHRSFLNKTIGEGDQLANRFGVAVTRNGEAVTLTGVTCNAYFIRSTGDTVVISDGVVSGNVAYVTLPQACYTQEGQFSLAIKLNGDGITGTMRIIDGVVSNTTTGSYIDPGTIIPSIEELIEAISEAVASIPADYEDLWTTFAPNFSTSESYYKGQYVVNDGKLWMFVADHSGSWSNDDVIQVAVGGSMYNMIKQISDDENMLEEEIGTRAFIFTDGGCIRTADSTIDINSVVSNATWKYCVIPCTAGDYFHIHITNASSTYRPYAFVASDGTKLSAATKNAIDDYIIAPVNSAYLVCNVNANSNSIVYIVSRGKNELQMQIDANADFIENEFGIRNCLFTDNGAIATNSATIDITSVVFGIDWKYCIVPCVEGDYFHVKIDMGSSIYRPWAFVASDGTRLSVASVNAVDTGLIAPENAAYLLCNVHLTSEDIGYSVVKGRINTVTEQDVQIDLYKKNLVGIFHTIGVIGDSLASGQGRVNDLNHYHDFYEYSWPQCMGRTLSNTVYNFTKSGLTTRSWLTDPMGYPLMSDGNHKCQCYIIGLGANDIDLGMDYLGSSSDINISDYTQDADTYYGNYARIISLIKEIEPRAVIFTIENPSYGDGTLRPYFNQAVAYMATIFDNVYNIVPDSTLFNSLTDFIAKNKVKGHYTPAAYLFIAEYLIGAMSNIIYNKPEDFYFANLIGTEYDTPDMDE